MSGAYELAEWMFAVTPEKLGPYQTKPYKHFLRDRGIQLPEDAADEIADWVLDNYRDDFEIWLSNQDPDKYPIDYPTPYTEQSTSPSNWYLHFTNYEFLQFNDGVRRQYIGNSGKERDRVVKCPDNLHAAPEDQRWIHAFGVFDDSDSVDLGMLQSGLGYGSTALLFQSDEVVYAKHSGHDQWHALVLCCSEKNAMRLTNLWVNKLDYEYWTLGGVAHLANGDYKFDDITKLIDKLEETNSSLGGFGRVTRKIGRWHRLARKY